MTYLCMVYLYIVIVVRTPGGAWAAASLGGMRKPVVIKKKKNDVGLCNNAR